MRGRIVLALVVVATVVACTRGPSDDEIREAVMLVGHATGSTVTRSVNARAELFAGSAYDDVERVVRFEQLDTGVYNLATPYASISGYVVLGETEIGEAEITLTGGPIAEIEFGYEDASPLADEWVVRGRADGRRFRIELTFDDVREFRRGADG